MKSSYKTMLPFCMVVFFTPVFCQDTSQELNSLQEFVYTEEYKKIPRIELEKIITTFLDNKADPHKKFSVKSERLFVWPHSLGVKGYETTALGRCTCHHLTNPCGYICADILVSKGAQLTGSYNNKFGFYFVKKLLSSFSTPYNSATPATKILEILLYQRVKYCIKKSLSIYLIVKRLKKKIPRPLVHAIADFIIAEGVKDVITVCNESVIETYGHDEEEKITLFSMWNKWKNLDLEWKADLKPLNALMWEQHFSDFKKKRNNPTWKPGKENLILRSFHYAPNTLYQDEELADQK